MTEYVILTDEHDRPVGTAEKLEAHQKGLRHRAVSVLISDSDGRLLLQRRAAGKYHSPGLWTNTCCSHPRPDEAPADAARRRLNEEMGLTAELYHAFTFEYRAELDGGLIEHEIDYVFLGISDHIPLLNPEEADHYAYYRPEEIENDLITAPHKFTEWFKILMPKVKEFLPVRKEL